jgi:2-hydroxy-3-keto-5-methylthiopentenyl-1-phosphate phosphatase
MLIICDFDGTVTARDTNSALAGRYAPETFRSLEGKLGRRELTLREVLTTEFRAVTAPLEELVEVALEISFRAGFDRFLDGAEAAGHQIVLLSSGFHEIIEPMLERDGHAGRVPLIANRIRVDGSGGTIIWRELPTCELCGEACKRSDVARLARAHPQGSVVFVGDGFSDRCGAEAADRVFARDSLARYLDERHAPYEAWDDFHDVARALHLAG